jgi:RNA polymerase sigma-70 factor (ECF subfamily)
VTTLPDRGAELLALYDRALPEVYGYLMARCSDRALAQDLTSEAFLAAFASSREAECTTGWLIGIARHKLVDHWRWKARQERLLEAVASDIAGEQVDPWDEQLDAIRAREVLAQLSTVHRAALTLRYLDGLPVAETAALLGRTLHATEALLVRARRSFRAAYTEGGSRG